MAGDLEADPAAAPEPDAKPSPGESDSEPDRG